MGTQTVPEAAQLVHGVSLSHLTLRLRQSSQLSWGVVVVFRGGSDLAGELRCSITMIELTLYFSVFLPLSVSVCRFFTLFIVSRSSL